MPPAGQLLGKDIVLHTWISPSGRQLHRTTAGFQFGAGKERQIVQSMEEVEEFEADAKRMVQNWLDSNGVRTAQKHILDREVAEQASERPGTLDAMADKLGPDMKAHIFELLQNALESKLGAPPAPAQNVPIGDEAESTVKVDGGALVTNENGLKEFVPGDDFDAADLEAEKALLAAQDAGRRKRAK